MCLHCGKVSIGSRCDACREKRKRLMQQKIKEGICTVDSCQFSSEPGYKTCHKHIQYDRFKKQKKKGLSDSDAYRQCSRPIIELLQDFDAIL